MKLGLDVLLTQPHLVRGKRLGVITNHTGATADFRPTVDVLAALGAQIVALFGPEHGYDGVVQDGLAIGAETRAVAGAGRAPVYSLYRGDESYDLPADALAGLDALVFDIQDVGVRYYTYLSTLGIVLEAAADAGLPVLVLDRPNPLGGRVEGPGLDPACRSFVGRYDVPVRHGLTLGEAARYLNATCLAGRAAVTVVPMEGWRRNRLWPATGLPWVPPSPNMPAFTTTLVYPGTCLLEGTTIAEGRGTTRPFEILGAPWIDAEDYTAALRALDLPGVQFRATRFVPAFDRYAGQVCGGVQVYPGDPAALDTVALGLHLIATARALYPAVSLWRPPATPGGLQHFDRLIGSQAVRPAIDAGTPVAALTAGWPASATAFRQARAPWLLYSEDGPSPKEERQ